MNKDVKVFGVDIDDTVKAAIAKAVLRTGSQRQFALLVKVSAVVPGTWMGKGKKTAKTIPHATYERLYPLIRAYLPPGDARYLPLSRRGEGDAAAPVAAPACVVACNEAEKRVVAYYRDLDPEDQAETLLSLKRQAAEAREKSAPKPAAASA